MSAWSVLAVATATLVARFLLAGSAIDLGAAAVVSAPAVLALAVGLGLVSRAKLPDMADALGLALLVPLRGPLCDAMAAVWPLSHGLHVAAAIVSLGPVGFFLGRAASSLVQDGALPLVLGWFLGEVAAMAGAVGFLPGPWTGVLAAVILGCLVELGRHRRRHTHGTPAPHVSWAALPIGCAFALLFFVLRRVAPAYAEPGAHLDGSLAVAFAGLSCVVLLPCAWLASGDPARRVVLAVGSLALGAAIWLTAMNLDLENKAFMFRQILTWELHNKVWTHPWLTDWWAWLLFFFVGYGAAALGLVLAGVGRAAAGPFVLGIGLGIAVETWVLAQPLHGPGQLALAGAGIAVMTALCAWRGKAVVLAPLGVAAALLWPAPTYEAVLRVGEPAADGFVRRLPADVLIPTTFGPRSSVRDVRVRYASMFTGRVLSSSRAELRALSDEASDAALPEIPARHAHDDGAEPDESLDAESMAQLGARHLGLRVAGAAAHAGHDPMGAEGSMGRLLRVFGVAGRVYVTGIGAELAAADAVDASLCADDAVELASAAPLTHAMALVLLGEYRSAGYRATASDDPAADARRRPAGAFATVVVTPERGAWPASGALLAEQSLERLRRLVAPGGRMLAWVDTSDLDARALAARLAAFGRAFGASAACFVEMRGLDAPLLLLVGWADEAGRPRAADIAASFDAPDETGLRTRLRDFDDLAAMLLADGAGLARLAADGPVHARGRPVPPNAFAETGWAAVARVLATLGSPAQLDMVLADATHDATPSAATPSDALRPNASPAPRARDLRPVAEGLAAHGRYSYHLHRIHGSLALEIVPDIDWDAFEAEVDLYVAAADADRDHPLLHLALASLLEPLALESDFGRFARTFERVGAAEMPSWRLALLHAMVLRAVLEGDAAAAALARSRALAGLP